MHILRISKPQKRKWGKDQWASKQSLLGLTKNYFVNNK